MTCVAAQTQAPIVEALADIVCQTRAVARALIVACTENCLAKIQDDDRRESSGHIMPIQRTWIGLLQNLVSAKTVR
jgi:hypothetical protein